MANEEKKLEDGSNHGLSRRQKILTTIAIFYGNITFGCAMTSFSPALTDFKNKFETDTSTISVVFTATTVCYMLGALTCSLIYRLMNRQLAVVVLFVGITTGMMIAPHVPTLATFYATGGLLGFCMGCYDTAQVVWIIEMWQSECGPYVQAQHFFYAIGSLLAPALMAPFLTTEDDEDDGSSEITTTTDDAEVEKNKRLFVPFTIIGCLCAVTASAQMLLFQFMRYKAPPPETGTEKIESKVNKTGNWLRRLWPGWKVARLVILTMLALGFDQGMEIYSMQFFPTFGQNSDLALTEEEAANTLTGVMAAFAAARGIGIIIIFKIPPQYILFADIAIVLVGNIILVTWGNTSLTMLWIAGIMYGLGFSSLMPALCAYMERHLVFTNTIGSMLIVTGSLLGSIYPLIVGRFIDDHPLVFSYPIFFSLAVMICAVGRAYWITNLSKKRRIKKQSLK